MRTLVIGTRGSQLARWQSDWAKSELERLNPGLEVQLKIITTKGDRVLDVSLPELGAQGKGLFTKELEDEMLAGSIDVAVHSLKDLPTEITPGLHIGAITRREDVRDALVARKGIASFDSLPEGACIGTSSLRRQAQIKAARQDLVLEPVRGNVDTRVRKVDGGGFDAVILASAGLRRLGHADRITQYLDESLVLPAVGQGALGIQTRADDADTNELVWGLDHEETHAACVAERAFLLGLGGGCIVPIAALAKIAGNELHIRGLVASPDGVEIIRGESSGLAADAQSAGRRLADELISRGANRLLSI